MNKIIQIPPEKTSEELWNDFVNKSIIAQKSLNFEDGIEARRAWIRFMNIYGVGS